MMTEAWQLRLIGLVVLLSIGCNPNGSNDPEIPLDHYSKIERDSGEFLPRTVIPDPFPPIVTPDVFETETADQGLSPGELVLGVVVDDLARAYPINMLTGPEREIINDKIGEHAIAATW